MRLGQNLPFRPSWENQPMATAHGRSALRPPLSRGPPIADPSLMLARHFLCYIAAWDPSARLVTHLAEDLPLNQGLRRFRR
jgi:hypothetical protein